MLSAAEGNVEVLGKSEEVIYGLVQEMVAKSPRSSSEWPVS